MKTKFLLIYGYALPILTSLVVSSLLMLFKFDYAQIAIFYASNQEILIGFFIGIAAIAFPFINSIINEDNPHVLTVLQRVREVFRFALMFQAMLIIGSLFVILFLSALKNQNYFIGWIQLLASSLITFETLALISNGRSYGNIREKIIVEVNKVEQKRD